MKYPKITTVYKVEPITGKQTFRVVRYKLIKTNAKAKEELLKKDTLVNDVDKDYAETYVFKKERNK